MKRIAAVMLAAAALFALVSAQTATQTQQKTNTTTQQTNTSTSPAPADTSTSTVETNAAIVSPTPWVDPIDPDPVDPDPVPEETTVTPRTGEKATKAVMTSCPIHPEVKTRVAGKCPVCRMEERKQAAALEKTQNAPLAPPDAAPTPTPAPTPVPEPVPEPTIDPVVREPVVRTYDPSQPIP